MGAKESIYYIGDDEDDGFSSWEACWRICGLFLHEKLISSSVERDHWKMQNLRQSLCYIIGWWEEVAGWVKRSQKKKNSRATSICSNHPTVI